jgi:hypothetical protein
MKSSHSGMGSRWLPAIDYPRPKQGFWYPQTSTINWCEEVWHPISLLLYIGLGLTWLIGLLRHHIRSGNCEYIDEPSLHVSWYQGSAKLFKAWARHCFPSVVFGIPGRGDRKLHVPQHAEV